MAQAKRRRRDPVTNGDVAVAPPPERRALSVPEVAYLLGCSTPQVRRLLDRDALPVMRIGRTVRVSRKAVEDFVANGGVPVVATRKARASAK